MWTDRARMLRLQSCREGDGTIESDWKTADGEALSVDNCDREPIHVPGHIQPFGTLIAGPVSLATVEHAGANLAAFAGVEAAEVLGRGFDAVLPHDALHDTRNLLSYATAASQRERVGRYDVRGRDCELYAHRSPDGAVVIEIEAVDAGADATVRSPIEQARLFLARAGSERSIDRMLRTAVVGLRELTGYDRVKAYRYAEDGSGEVVAESRAGHADSFLGLRYPAWDVPAQARALQVRNPLRLLSDVGQDPVPLLGAGGEGATLDLSLAHLRGVSPIHVEYLVNMGVGATLTVGLVVDGRLWGMFACHHMTPRVIGSDTRIAAELFGQVISLLIKEQQENEQAQARGRAAGARQALVAEMDATSDLLTNFPVVARVFRELIACDGLAVMREGRIETDGSVPPEDTIRALGAHAPEQENLLAGTDGLSEAGWARGADGAAPELGPTAGCLIVRATAAYPLQLLFFRDEVARSVAWAGNPEKEIGHGPFGPRITPRGSFAAYLEEQSGRAAPWSPFDMGAAREVQTMLTQITAKAERDQLSRHKDLVSHKRQQDLMIAELNHRVKNILALIRSLSRQAKASSASLESYALALEQRIGALAMAHDLAVSDQMRGVSLRSILETELRPYGGEETAQVVLSGPDVGLRADVAPMIALVFHEIVTNAAKYGALSTPDGVVQLRWSLDGDGALRGTWRELGGPPVVPPERHGFGRSLIERAIPYEFDGTAALDYHPAGLRFDFSLPADALVEMADVAAAPEPAAPHVSEIVRVATGRSALLVEDNVVLAMDMVESLTRLGAERIATAGTVTQGLAQLAEARPDFAVLDMNLRGEVVFDLALALRAAEVPFLFVTGYGSKIDVPAELDGVRILTKPVDDGTLSQGLTAILDG